MNDSIRRPHGSLFAHFLFAGAFLALTAGRPAAAQSATPAPEPATAPCPSDPVAHCWDAFEAAEWGKLTDCLQATLVEQEAALEEALAQATVQAGQSMDKKSATRTLARATRAGSSTATPNTIASWPRWPDAIIPTSASSPQDPPDDGAHRRLEVRRVSLGAQRLRELAAVCLLSAALDRAAATRLAERLAPEVDFRFSAAGPPAAHRIALLTYRGIRGSADESQDHEGPLRSTSKAAVSTASGRA
jgi:hypothetical protein